MSSPSPSPHHDATDYPGVLEPMAPALMRAAHARAIARVFSEVQAAGFPEIRAAHMPVFQFPGPHNSSPVAIARRSGRSKQHINLLLNDLESAGYVERGPDPNRARGIVVLLTQRGMALVAAMRLALEQVETDWARRLGARRFTALKAALEDLNDTETSAEHASAEARA
jgi:DNA-binding MarR family transcriptional regulator